MKNGKIASLLLACKNCVFNSSVLFFASFAFLSLSAFATQQAQLMTFYTEGPDCYADGSPVLDGECYALVLQLKTAGDITFTLSGEPTDPSVAKVLRVLPRAKDGRCPETTFSVESDDLPKFGTKSGVLRLYLFDTRVYAAGSVAVGGATAPVQAAVPVTATVSVKTGTTAGAVKLASYQRSLLPDDAPNPRITDISVSDDSVVLSVADLIEGVNYSVYDPLTGLVLPTEASVTGTEDGTAQIMVPRTTAGSAFFRVGRK